MIYADNENINPNKYSDIRSGSSRSIPINNEDVGDLLNNISSKNLSYRSSFSESTNGNFKENEELLNSIESWYSRALDLVGLNFSNPLETYGTYFNKNMQTLGLDPQRPGNSYVFFTRPDINLSRSTKGFSPFFDYIMTTEIGNYVAEYLQYPNVEDSKVMLDKKYKTDCPFDPLKTNLCKEISGVKDIVLDSFETTGDFMGHQLTYATGADGYDSIGEVTITFADTLLSPIFLSHFLLIQYIHEVARGEYWPKYKYLARRIIDYTISIYIFKLSEDNRTILRWGRLCGCYPINIPLDSLNYSNEVKLDELDNLSITYKYNFWEPMNPRTFIDFNKLMYPLSIENITGVLWDKNVNPEFYGSLELKEPYHPEKLVESLDVEELSRNETPWGKYPLIIGNKLIFV